MHLKTRSALSRFPQAGKLSCWGCQSLSMSHLLEPEPHLRNGIFERLIELCVTPRWFWCNFPARWMSAHSGESFSRSQFFSCLKASEWSRLSPGSISFWIAKAALNTKVGETSQNVFLCAESKLLAIRSILFPDLLMNVFAAWEKVWVRLLEAFWEEISFLIQKIMCVDPFKSQRQVSKWKSVRCLTNPGK